MKVRIWPFVSSSFGIFLLLVVLFAWIVSRKAAQIDSKAREAHAQYQQADDEIAGIRSDVYRAALLARGALQPADRAAPLREIRAIRQSALNRTEKLSSLLGQAQHQLLTSLARELSDYWGSVERSTSAATEEGARAESYWSEQSDQREKVLRLARELDALNRANLKVEEQNIYQQQGTLRQFTMAATGVLFLLGMVIAVASTTYLAKLERVSARQKVRAERAEYELRRLSNQLVRVQEEERRTISRELHDEVGQILTGLRMELGGLWRGEADSRFRERLDSLKHLAEESLRGVRDLALLLRPSMLDDLGLGPALRWQAKEFSRRSGIPVSVDIEGHFDHLPENYRICLYRTIQEALTNCIKHAEASRVTVTVKQEGDLVSASVQDNGKGFDAPHLRTDGLGLVGMEERVRALEGRLTITSQSGEGTLVKLDLPLAAEPAEATAT